MIVILTKEDMTKYRISPETLEGFGKDTRSALRRIVRDAGEDAAFAAVRAAVKEEKKNRKQKKKHKSA